MIVGMIYAGGQARRMGGTDKPLTLLAGAPLIAWAVSRLAPQVAHLAIAGRGGADRFRGLPATALADPPESGAAGWGPVAGLLSGLSWAHALGAQWLATAPADAPFLPLDLVAVLAQAQAPAVACTDQGREPACAVWRVCQAPVIVAAVEHGERALWALLERCAAQDVMAPRSQPPPFFNVNTPADLIEAERLVAHFGLPAPRFSDDS